jgi:hypothetical protein
MPVGTTDSLGRYYWCHTASSTDANCWYYRLLRQLRNQSVKGLDFRSEFYPTFLGVEEGVVEVSLA